MDDNNPYILDKSQTNFSNVNSSFVILNYSAVAQGVDKDSVCVYIYISIYKIYRYSMCTVYIYIV